MTVSGAGAVLRGTDPRGVTTFVGNGGPGGNGSLQVSGGGRVETFGSVYGATDGSVGQLSLFGAGSSYAESQNMFLGTAGRGLLTARDATTVTVGGTLSLGTGFGGQGTASLRDAGTVLTVDGGLFVGENSLGRVIVSDDALVDSDGGVTALGAFRDAATGRDGDGQITLTGGRLQAADLVLGFQGTGAPQGLRRGDGVGERCVRRRRGGQHGIV